MLAIAGSGSALADSAQQARAPVTIYYFWGDGCPHCAEAKPFLADLAQRYPGVQIRDFEVWYNEANREPLVRMAARSGFEPSGVPTIFIGDQYWVGYSKEVTGPAIEAAVAACVRSGCTDAGAGILAPLPPAPQAAAVPPPAAVEPPAARSDTLTLPLVGQVNLATQSLLLSTALIAFVDGFNPCSLWVLSILIALTLHTGSRRKVVIVGLVFLAVTSLVYALFIGGLFTMFAIVSFAGWLRALVAAVALLFAVINIKDYFWYRKGLSLTISDSQKPGLFKNMRRVLNAGDSLPALVGATAVMAAGASLVEFSCTAGFPVLWTNLVAAQEVTLTVFALLLGLYMLIYLVDELAIFGAAVVTMRASRIEEHHGRILKLVGGMLMLTLAGVMLLAPHLMDGIGTSLLVFGIAFAAAGLVLLLHRVILPRLGLSIGDVAMRRQGNLDQSN